MMASTVKNKLRCCFWRNLSCLSDIFFLASFLNRSVFCGTFSHQHISPYICICKAQKTVHSLPNSPDIFCPLAQVLSLSLLLTHKLACIATVLLIFLQIFSLAAPLRWELVPVLASCTLQATLCLSDQENLRFKSSTWQSPSRDWQTE